MLLFYIDPGTGSMLFSILIGLVTMLYFMGKAAFIKLKFVLSGGKAVSNKDRYPFVIYSEGDRYWNVFKPVVEEFEKRKVPVVFYTSSENDPVFFEKFIYVRAEFIGEGNKAFTRLNFLEADICLMTTPGLDVYQLKRSRGVKHYSHILHSPGDATTYRLFGLDYFDSVLLTGEYQKEHLRLLEKKRGIQVKDLEVVGCPYLDVLQEKASFLEVADDKPFTVLVAPSWGSSGILARYGEELLDPLVETGFTIIVRPHPQSALSEKEILEHLRKRYEQHSNLEWDFSRENLIALSRADIMISDFSGVIFDFVFLFDRPVMYVKADFDAMPYDAYDIEEEPWTFRVLKEIGIELKPENFSTLKELFLEACEDALLTENRAKAKDTAWQYRGKSGERVVDYLMRKQENLKGTILARHN
jgi:hypothetical protein